MSLDFQQLSTRVEEMAQSSRGRRQLRDGRIQDVARFIEAHATEAEKIEGSYSFIDQNLLRVNQPRPFVGSARPLSWALNQSPLNAVSPFDPSLLPERATLISVDGSQIVPDRHAPFLYYLINTGGIIYHHGERTAPDVFTQPLLEFPEEDDLDDTQFASPSYVSVLRDLAEINQLADQTALHKRDGVPLLATMDQRLLYVPDLGPKEKDRTIKTWQRAMGRVREAGGILAGYIDRPAKSGVITMLRTIHPDWSTDQPNNLGEWQGLTDVDLFAQLLKPGERSNLFVDVSKANHNYRTADPAHEICFFYLNSAQPGLTLPGIDEGKTQNVNIARIDLPIWVAQNREMVDLIHMLIYDQCLILGRYPYILTRADEMAVVGRQDQAELEFRIARQMDRYGLMHDETAKQWSKSVARGNKQAHMV